MAKEDIYSQIICPNCDWKTLEKVYVCEKCGEDLTIERKRITNKHIEAFIGFKSKNKSKKSKVRRQKNYERKLAKFLEG